MRCTDCSKHAMLICCPVSLCLFQFFLVFQRKSESLNSQPATAQLLVNHFSFADLAKEIRISKIIHILMASVTKKLLSKAAVILFSISSKYDLKMLFFCQT